MAKKGKKLVQGSTCIYSVHNCPLNGQIFFIEIKNDRQIVKITESKDSLRSYMVYLSILCAN